ncbi:MAG: transporter substrate-binding domain-containing protein [Thermoanaerobaculales bacterium]
MMRSLLSLVIALSVFASVPTGVLAAEGPSTIAKIVDSGTFRIGMSGTQPPFTVMSKSGELIGYEVDVANLLANAIGVELELVQLPFAELLPALEKGEIDAVMSGMTMTPQRNTRVAFVGPYIVSGKSILTKSSILAAIKDAEEIDRSSIKIVALKGSTSEKFVQKVLEKTTLIGVDDYDTGVQMVIDGKADALVADYPICVLSQMRFPDAGLATLAEPMTIEPIGIALAPGDPLLLNMVENYLGTLQGLGLLDLLEEKWFEDGAWLIQLP